MKSLLLAIVYGLRNLLNYFRAEHRFHKVSQDFQSSSDIEAFQLYASDSATELKALCDKYNSDKGSLKLTKSSYPWPAHNYATIYNVLLGRKRFSVEAFFECGIGPVTSDFQTFGTRTENLSSLSLWREYFPNAEIVGVDIDPQSLVESDKVQSFLLDQTNSSDVTEFWAKNNLPDFDVMIDDGLHSFLAITTLFSASFHKLKSDGIYFVEDVHVNDLIGLRHFFSTQFDNLQADYIIGPKSRHMNNNLIAIQKI